MATHPRTTPHKERLQVNDIQIRNVEKRDSKAALRRDKTQQQMKEFGKHRKK
jgi:hypothetical protein